MALKLMSRKQQGQLTSAAEIAEATGTSFEAVARVLQQMTAKGLLQSEQGVHGGYAIVRDLNRVSVFELMEWLLGPVAVAKCLQKENECELRGSCNIVSPITAFNRRLSDFYRGLKVGELLSVREPARVHEEVSL